MGFNQKSSCYTLRTGRFWPSYASRDSIANDKVIFEFPIRIINSCTERGTPIDAGQFAAPNRMSNVTLKIGDQKLYVSKEYLAVLSPVFEAMFFRDFAENGKEEVELKDVEYGEFVDLLHLIYHDTMVITDCTVLHILKLSDQFQIEKILEHAKKHLTQSSTIDTLTKLLAADRYGITDLKEHCLDSFTTVTELEKMQKCPEYDSFSAEMKSAICYRIAKLKLG